jgi:DNA-binding NarL/FixJ family response regulator
MTWSEPPADSDRVRDDFAWLEDLLATAGLTADDPAGQALKLFVLALCTAAPQPRDGFEERVFERLRNKYLEEIEDRALERLRDQCLEEIAAEGITAAHAPPAVEHGGDRRRRTGQPRSRTTARQEIRVVVAEDHPLLREGLIRALERDPGIEVIGEADNGLSAMALARELKPDVMVLDPRLPGLGGAVALERLRAELPEVKALVMTADDSPESLLDAVAAGAAGYLSKRTTGEELCQAVITTYGGGSVITPELAGHLLREFSGGARGEGSVRPLLADRELEILRLVADGLTDNEIGKRLYISPRTVHSHLTRIREKTNLRRRSALAAWLGALPQRGQGRAG